MAYDFKAFDKRIADIVERAGKELSGIRTGRAAPMILDGITVESYGTRMPLNQVANIAIKMRARSGWRLGTSRWPRILKRR